MSVKIEKPGNKFRNLRMYKMILASLFAALTAVFTQIILPIGPVPISLSLIAVFTAGALLGAKYAVLSQVIFMALGAVGVPVFTGFQGGIAKLLGPTGGYIVGYLLTALIIGFASDRFKNNFLITALSMIVGLIMCYALGTAWFMYSTQTPLWSALASCVVPFIIGDLVKIAVSTVISIPLKKHIKKV